MVLAMKIQLKLLKIRQIPILKSVQQITVIFSFNMILLTLYKLEDMEFKQQMIFQEEIQKFGNYM
jgi:hypothetical protein